MNPFHGVDIQASTIDALVDRLTPVFKGLPIEAPIVKAGTKLYRARIVSDRVAITSEVGVPHASKVQKLGRLNDAEEAVGYFSTSRRSAYFEIQPKVGDCVILSRWVLNEDMIFLHVGYTPEVFKGLTSSRSGEEYDWAVKMGESESRVQETYAFLSKELCKRVSLGDEWQYKTTIAIGRKFLGSGPHDGLLYPTIAMSGNSDNVAIKLESLKKIQIQSIEYNRITSSSGMKMGVDFIDSATKWDENGAIIWNGRRLNWTLGPGQEATAKVEDGEWVLYDEEDTEIERN